MAPTEEILGQFLGDEAFPVDWASDVERDFFWVYDDLHIPHPVSPMFFDIGGWWLSCDHMFRRFGTPFAVDWLAKNVNGYVYTTAIPADPDLRIDGTEYSARYGARVPRDATFATTMGAYLDTVLPVYGRDFADWWRDRLRPEMERNFAFLEARLDAADGMDLADVACLLEDAIDVHDRHWKIHWMLNFAQLSATLDLRAVMEKHRGTVDEPLLGRLQNSASDRNWDSIEALWRMKNEVRDDAELRAAFAVRRRRRDRRVPALERPRPAVHRRARRAVPARVRLACRLEPRVHLPDRPRADGAGPRAHPRLPGDRLRLPERHRGDAPRHRGGVARDPRGAHRRRARGDAGGERRQPPDGAAHARPPLLHRPGRERPRSARAHGGRPQARRGRPPRPAPDDVMFLRYNELRGLIGSADAIPAREIVASRRLEREAAASIRPRDWIGTVTPSQLAFPYLVNWGYPDRFYQKQSDDQRLITGLGASAGVVEGIARVVRTVDEFDEVRDGDILVCQMTNPAWVVLFTKIAGLVTDTGGTTSHPAVLAREFGIPAVIGTSVATHRIVTGDRLRIDGTAGRVEILRDESAAPAVGSASAIGR